VSYLSHFVGQGESNQNALLRSQGLEDLPIQGRHGILLLIDPQPRANWSHPCWIATYDIDKGAIKVARSDFPPRQEADRRLVRLAAPADSPAAGPLARRSRN
jgi:hypothetical protein